MIILYIILLCQGIYPLSKGRDDACLVLARQRKSKWEENAVRVLA